MGSACQKEVDNSLYQGQQYFSNLCNIFRAYINLIEDEDVANIQLKAYLIATKSIPNFISLIKKFNYLENDDRIYLGKEESFEMDKNIEIINQYSQCINLINDDNGKNNEFIIVNKEFIQNMKIINSDDKLVNIIIDHKKNYNEIKFSESQNINFNSITKGFYKFVKFNESTIKPKSGGTYINSTSINKNKIPNESHNTLVQLKKEKLVSIFMNQLCQKEMSAISENNPNTNVNDILNQVNTQ